MMLKNFVISLSFLFIMGTAMAQSFEYIGAVKCKMCHNKSTTGKQYDQWASTSHSKAFDVLKGEKAMTYAKEKGIADPSKEAKCLKCHSTYHSAAASLMTTITAEEGVSCESCHGPGSAYKAMNIMKSREASLKNGLIMPTKEVCVACHKKEGNDFYKPFNYDEAIKKIAHPNPAK